MTEWAAIDAVRSFEAALRSIRDRVIAQIADAGSIEDVVHMAQRGAVPRDGALEDGTRYSVHGIGCRMADPQGLEVDVDIDEKGRGIFDDWRIIMHWVAVSGEYRSREEILAACRRLVDSGELIELRQNWFCLPD
ncbi:hypothetical protein MTP10_31205 [Nonomuraea sp. 3-1Str]|uniref:DUF6896 domain-containing protein n=1 Tax=Nonomuraea sp. 3-1Str TaxID=2929801 RepID=UPI002865BE3D|nr:hypothetical protein [Nonomuraea sp. 3-1Str]MDR8413188.1 hypothetical protein [Nonomuraea sp. 3-1Str]